MQYVYVYVYYLLFYYCILIFEKALTVCLLLYKFSKKAHKSATHVAEEETKPKTAT